MRRDMAPLPSASHGVLCNAVRLQELTVSLEGKCGVSGAKPRCSYVKTGELRLFEAQWTQNLRNVESSVEDLVRPKGHGGD